jgi:hypothetical protein
MPVILPDRRRKNQPLDAHFVSHPVIGHRPIPDETRPAKKTTVEGEGGEGGESDKASGGESDKARAVFSLWQMGYYWSQRGMFLGCQSENVCALVGTVKWVQIT